MFVVTGATSNTGSAVATALLDRDVPVRVIGRSRERLQPFVDRGAEPVCAEPSDKEALTKAFAGTTAVYVMLQPGFIATSEDFPAYQRASVEAISAALVDSRARHVVALSGWGANYEKASGPLEGLRILETRLNEIEGVNSLVLRPGWFMENAISFIRDIARDGRASGQLRGDLKLPMIATKDIGEVVADALLQHTFQGNLASEVEGPATLSLDEAAAIVGELAGRSTATYVRVSVSEARAQFLDSGFSEHMADAFVRMTNDLNEERIRMLQPPEARIVTRTSFRTFAETILAAPNLA